ncbi:MAG: family polymerase sigma factor [Myxococcales bacterium]|nr:family polymerase sigma factor [Myxococcales bacterium]
MSVSPVFGGELASSFEKVETGTPPVRPANDCARSLEDRVTTLYRRHRAAILGRCQRVLRDAAAAEDALQETFMRVLRHADKAPPGDEALPWMYRIATNYCLNELRNGLTARQATDELAEQTPRSHAPVESAVVNRDLARQVLASVPDKVRVVALLRHVDGLHDGEVADALGLGRRTVVYRLRAFKEKGTRHLGASL